MEHIRSVVSGLMVFVALGCAGWALAAHGGRWNMRLDILTHFAPMLLAAAIVPLVYGLAFESGWPRAALLVLGGLATLAAGLLVAPEYMRPRSEPAAAGAPGQIKLIQFNAWGRNTQHGETIAWLAAQDADILVVEEAARIGDELKAGLRGYHVSCGHCSVMIFSKAVPVAQDVPVEATENRIRPPIAGATFEDERGRYSVFGTHYTWPVYGGWQQAQGRVIARLLNKFPKDRLILTGDFNSTPWSFSRQREDAMFGIERRTRALFSWPAGRFSRLPFNMPFPVLPIDHVYAGPGWRTVSVERGPKLGSDHYPVVVVLAPSA